MRQLVTFLLSSSVILVKFLVFSSSAELTCAWAAIVASAIIAENVPIGREEVAHYAACNPDLTMTLTEARLIVSHGLWLIMLAKDRRVIVLLPAVCIFRLQCSFKEVHS